MGKVKKLRSKAAAKLSSAKTSNNEGKIKLNTNIGNKVHKKKTEKLKQKKADFIKKINLIKEQKTKLQKKERGKSSLVKNKKASFVGDLKSLKDALPSMDELFRLKRDEIKVRYKTQSDDEVHLSRKDRIKKRKKEFLNRYNCFETLLKDPEYKRNPRDAIAFHIRYTNGLET